MAPANTRRPRVVGCNAGQAECAGFSRRHEAKLEILRRQLYESEIQQVETQAKVLNTAIFNGQLHTPNAMRALRILLNIAGQLLLGASGNALYEALAHFAGLG